ncbi:unnamed protein product [Lampetra planeri]
MATVTVVIGVIASHGQAEDTAGGPRVEESAKLSPTRAPLQSSLPRRLFNQQWSERAIVGLRPHLFLYSGTTAAIRGLSRNRTQIHAPAHISGSGSWAGGQGANASLPSPAATAPLVVAMEECGERWGEAPAGRESAGHPGKDRGGGGDDDDGDPARCAVPCGHNDWTGRALSPHR